MSYNNTTPQWIKIIKSYSDFAAAALTNDIEIYSLAAKNMIHAVQIFPSTTFSGGLINGYTISVGIAGNLVKYSVATNVFTGAALAQPSVISGVESMSGATSIRAQAVSGVGNLNTAVQGTVDIYLLVSKLP